MPRVAVSQLNATDSVEANLKQIEEHVVAAVADGAEAIFLPECCALMQTSRDQLRRTAEPPGAGPIQAALSRYAKDNAILLFAGSIPLESDDPKRVYNSSLVYDKEGACIARYDKMHLFDVTLDSGEQYLESAYTCPGTEIVMVETALGAVGLTVCYDLRFPELYRALSSQGAELMLVPSAFSVTTGPAHWLPLLQARAIENLCYVIAAAQVGTHPSGRKTWGHSVVIDPWGRVAAEKPDGVGLLMAEIDRNEIVSGRRQLPSLEHRSPALHCSE